ncbi:MAG: hypothetical protein ABS879_01315, partial [Eubacteriales bacterium]
LSASAQNSRERVLNCEMNAHSAMDIYTKAKYNKPEQLSETIGNVLNNEFKAAGARYSLFRREEYWYSWNFMMSRSPDISYSELFYSSSRNTRDLIVRYVRKVKLVFICI